MMKFVEWRVSQKILRAFLFLDAKKNLSVAT